MTKDPLQTALDAVARHHLHVETLETRGRDSLDFHDCSVAGIKAALEAAWRQGFEAGLHAATPEQETDQ